MPSLFFNQVSYYMSQYQKLQRHPSPLTTCVDANSSTSSCSKNDNNKNNSAITLEYSGLAAAAAYVLSGVTQPLIMTLAHEVGIANARAQLYMLFYYLGPATIVTWFVPKWPSNPWSMLKVCAIALFDIMAQGLNYTGSTLAGPTLFAIIYSSVTLWTAMFSYFLLHRPLNKFQWGAVLQVVLGLALTGCSTTTLGHDVMMGSILIFCGSMMHALTYVMSEAVMMVRTPKHKGSDHKYPTTMTPLHSTTALLTVAAVAVVPKEDEEEGFDEDAVSVTANCAIQGMVGSVCLGIWQITYTRSHWEEVMARPFHQAGYGILPVYLILGAFFLANTIHSSSFFYTLRHFPGGATSAGVMKALQAVLVFTVSSFVYCGRLGGPEMCFSSLKFVSLMVVSGGVMIFKWATPSSSSSSSSSSSRNRKRNASTGYERSHDTNNAAVPHSYQHGNVCGGSSNSGVGHV